MMNQGGERSSANSTMIIIRARDLKEPGPRARRRPVVAAAPPMQQTNAGATVISYLAPVNAALLRGFGRRRDAARAGQ